MGGKRQLRERARKNMDEASDEEFEPKYLFFLIFRSLSRKKKKRDLKRKYKKTINTAAGKLNLSNT